jgi:oxygen-independent coproporphyrinogen-3 oxidase
MEYGLYLHLPYCRSLCPYCAFAKAPLHHAEPSRLLEALRAEWEMARARDTAWSRPRTIFFGGGTPTALDEETLGRLFAWIRTAFDTSRVREWTVEANPEGLTVAKLQLLRESGVDRLSLGVQSLEPGPLRSLGRIHEPERPLEALEEARRAGFTNVSVDLMVGVPGETLEGIFRAVDLFADLGVAHVSIYALQVEEGTPLEAKAARNAIRIPDEDDAGERMALAAERLLGRGFRHYEVSNFARPGFESRHNQGYWTRRPYLGLGPGAHSFDGARRWRNEEGVTRYYERVESGSLPREETQQLTGRDAAEESIVLALRRSRGLKRAQLDRWAGAPVPEWAKWAAGAGALRLDPPGRVRPTTRGLLVAHEISAELLARMGPGAPPRAVP